MADRGDLDEQRQDQRDGAERPDVGAAHDVQRHRCGLAAAEAVGQVSQAVQMQPPGEERENSHREAGRGQRAGTERMIGHNEHRCRDDPKQQSDRWRPRHRSSRGGPARLADGITQWDDGQQRHGQPQTAPPHADGAYRPPAKRRTISRGDQR